MMIRKLSLIGLLLTFIIIGCEKDKEQINNSAGILIGNWINPQYSDSIITYERSDSLKYNDYGFTFKSDFKFIERKNSGWCGTPPIFYADYDGTWIKNGSAVTIRVGYWGGLVDYKWKILSVDSSNLTLIKLTEDYH